MISHRAIRDPSLPDRLSPGSQTEPAQGPGDEKICLFMTSVVRDSYPPVPAGLSLSTERLKGLFPRRPIRLAKVSVA